MKLKSEIVDYLAKRIVDHLVTADAIEYEGDEEPIIELVGGAISEDLMVEDRLNDEVKDILRDQEQEIDENNINYRKMFQMVKMKLARERGLIL